MANRITSDRVPGAVSLRLSNGLTAVVLDVLALAGARRATTDWERRLVYWIVQHDQTRIGVGVVGFDVADLGWTHADFAAQQAFVLAVIDAALARDGWERLPFTPAEDRLFPALRDLRALLAAFPVDAIAAGPVDTWVPDELPALGTCEQHGLPLHELGCLVCNDAPVAAALPTAPRLDVAAWNAAYAAFLADPGPWYFLVEWARAAACLPVYCEWTHVFGVTGDGAVLVYEHDAPPGRPAAPSRIETDPLWLNRALIQGRERYPWLAALLPPRPADARTCTECDAVAAVRAAGHNVICYCGGAGWVPADDTWLDRKR